MNVTELARRIKVSPNEMRDLLPRLGFDIGRKAIKVDDVSARKIINMIEMDASLITKYRKEKLGVVETPVETSTAAPIHITIPPIITVRDFAGLINKPVAAVIQELMKNGILANLNERIDFDTASIIAQDFGYTTAQATAEQAEAHTDDQREAILKDSTDTQTRPPIVVVMGHVDHGKTMLLDTIRKTNVVGGESGGITQHIGAYQTIRNGKSITFIDTPGHEAFTTMRSRGARVADIAILVVAADDGIKPQTEEALSIIQSAKLPFVVALNKVDKPDADVQKVQQQLAQKNLLPEEWGGKTIVVPVSAKTGAGIDQLLESVLLVAEMEKETIVANPNRAAAGTVIEAHVDKGEGPVATVIIQTGTLRRGDPIQVGNVVGKIRAMKNHRGVDITEAPPATPVKLLGLKQSPEVGDILQVTTDTRSLRKIEKQLHHQARRYHDQQTWKQVQPTTPTDELDTSATVHIILKTDTLGSQEAITQSLEKVVARDVNVEIVKKGLGNISDNDILEAASTGARIYGFNVKMSPHAQTMAQENNVYTRTDSIIYNLIDDVQNYVDSLVTIEKVRVELGRAKVLAIFRTDRKQMIVGAQITKGKAVVEARAQIFRDDALIADVTITGLQKGKEPVKEMPSGTECGIALKGTGDLKPNDILEIYSIELKS
ncbi:MAG: translation initiation factor IF-2 [Candidatus Kerfeldbacteria bacterium]|nr:translation initiation factor IF-2 [Candidatus Kerfeldbacteria bacterium]